MTNQDGKVFGDLVALLEELAPKYGIGLPYNGLAAKTHESVYNLIRILALVTAKASERERMEIAQIVDDLTPESFATGTLPGDIAGNMYVAASQSKTTFGLAPEAIATTLKTLREERGLSQTEAASLCGMARQYWSDVERGQRKLRSTTLQKIAAAFGVPYPDLVRRIRGDK